AGGAGAEGDTPKPGDQVLASIFAGGERVDVVGTGRGKGFQGVVRRHHFAGGAATHGSMFHRAPGSIGASSFPSRVIKGMRGAGRMGGGRVTIRNLKVLRVDPENHLLIVEGGIPGAPTGYVTVRKAAAAKRIKVAQVEKPKKAAVVSGSGKKPWKQKGAGRARVGEIRNPLWRHGGTVFGPQPRSYEYSVPKKVELGALRAALSQKLRDGHLVVVDELAAGE